MAERDGGVESSGYEDRDSIQSVERAFKVLLAFTAETPDLTSAQVAQMCGMSRGTARRFLITLERLGYVAADGRTYHLQPKLLNLGFAYLTSRSIWETVHRRLEQLVDEVEESSSAAVLDGTSILYTVRVPRRRIFSRTVDVGSRLPAHATSMGKILLAALSETELDCYLAEGELEKFTEKTVTSVPAFRNEFRAIRNRGWAIADQELEAGVRSVSVGVKSRDGVTLAALNLSTNSVSVPMTRLKGELLPALQHAATDIEATLALRRT